MKSAVKFLSTIDLKWQVDTINELLIVHQQSPIISVVTACTVDLYSCTNCHCQKENILFLALSPRLYANE